MKIIYKSNFINIMLYKNGERIVNERLDFPTWANFVAVDKNGDIFAYSKQPTKSLRDNYWIESYGQVEHLANVEHNVLNFDTTCTMLISGCTLQIDVK